MYEVLLAGGFTSGGLNFDAKVRRGSFQEDDLFLSYIAGMDTFAKGLRVAAKLIEDGVFEQFIAKRYESFTEGIGKDIVGGRVGFRITSYNVCYTKLLRKRPNMPFGRFCYKN